MLAGPKPTSIKKRDEAMTCMLRIPLHHTTWSVVELCVPASRYRMVAVRVSVWYGLVVELCVLYQPLVVVQRVCVVVRSFVRVNLDLPEPPITEVDADN